MSKEDRALELLAEAKAKIDAAIILLDTPPAQDADRWTAAMLALEPDSHTGAWGMSARTARAQVSMPGGRAASERIVQINTTRKAPDGYWERMRKVAAEHDIPSALLIALACRESHHGHALDSRGYGDRGHGFGVLQVDSRHHKQAGKPDPYSIEHMRQAAGIFAGYRDKVAAKHKDWADKYILKGACVAYNSGVRNVDTIPGMDLGTTGGDYGADVMARAQIYHRRGY